MRVTGVLCAAADATGTRTASAPPATTTSPMSKVSPGIVRVVKSVPPC